MKGYEGLYEVSDLARVRSLDHVANGKDKNGNPFTRVCKGKMMKQRISNNGYVAVLLCKDGVKKNCFVHRLVAESFVPNPHDFPVVNHKDEDPSNNLPSNLEWCTQYYNMNYKCKDEEVRAALKRSLKRNKGNRNMKPQTLEERIKNLRFALRVLRDLQYEDPTAGMANTIEQVESKLRKVYHEAGWHCVSLIENGSATDVLFEGTHEACQEYASILVEGQPVYKGNIIITPF